jgi:hypothetical protein
MERAMSAGTFLARIADDRRARVAEMKLATPSHLLRARLGRPSPRPARACAAPRRSKRCAEAAVRGQARLTGQGHAQRTRGPGRDGPLFQAGGAAAISLVTEPDHFQGSSQWMNAVRPEVSLPLLLKDFVIDSYQLLDAHARRGRRAMLLAALLSETEMQRLIGEAEQLGLDPLAEVHTVEELHAALRCGSDAGRASTTATCARSSST